jgi:hypothetical protein
MELQSKLRNLLVGLVLSYCASAQADCYDHAAYQYQVNPWVLRAIVDVESEGNPSAVRKNRNGSIDRGAAQINSVHLNELAQYGIGPNELMNECVSINVAGWLLRKRIKEFGNTCRALGSYHNKNERERNDYIEKIRGALWKRNIILNCVDGQGAPAGKQYHQR